MRLKCTVSSFDELHAAVLEAMTPQQPEFDASTKLIIALEGGDEVEDVSQVSQCCCGRWWWWC